MLKSKLTLNIFDMKKDYKNIAVSKDKNSIMDSLKYAGNILSFRKIGLSIFFALLLLFGGQAATITTTGSGNWSSTTNNAP